MRPHPCFFSGLAGVSLLLAACGEPVVSADAAPDHADHTEAGAGVTFKAGRGLQLPPPVVMALGVRTAEAEERPLTGVLNVTAQVFAIQPGVLASARLSIEQADRLGNSSFTEAKVVRIDRTALAATRLVELVLALDAAPPRKVGDFVTLALAVKPRTVLTVPRSAVLEGAASTFVYVVNSGAYLRTPVKVGARSPDFLEITDGLYVGDVVVVTPVDQLWLTELRLTKGGGHSH